MQRTLRLGTRGSPLALIQAELVKKNLLAAYPEMGKSLAVEIVPIRTSGDWKAEQKDKSFIELGGNKGLFTKEIEEALLGNHIDIAVHSMKDVASALPAHLEIGAILTRADARDAFISRTAKTLDELPKGATIGTSSLRRKSQLLAYRPDLRVVPLRGNVETRLQKITDGQAEATLLAVAGLERLGMTNRISSILDMEVMLPAAAQGAIGIEIRTGDEETKSLLASLNSPETMLCVTAERALLKILDGSCYTPIGVHAHVLSAGQIMLRAAVAREDGTGMIRMQETASLIDAEALGQRMGKALKEQLPKDFFAA